MTGTIEADAAGIGELARAFGATGVTVAAGRAAAARAVDGTRDGPLGWTGRAEAGFAARWAAHAAAADGLARGCAEAGRILARLGVETVDAQARWTLAATAAASAGGSLAPDGTVRRPWGPGAPATASVGGALHLDEVAAAAERAARDALAALALARARAVRELTAVLDVGSGSGLDDVRLGVRLLSWANGLAGAPAAYAGVAESRAQALGAVASGLSRQWRAGATAELRSAAAGAIRPAAGAAATARSTAAGARATADAMPGGRALGVLSATVSDALGGTAEDTVLGRLPVVGTSLTLAGVGLSIAGGTSPVRAVTGAALSAGAGSIAFDVVGGGLVAAGMTGAAPVILTGLAAAGVAYGVGKGVEYAFDHGAGWARGAGSAGAKLWHGLAG